MGRPKGSTQHSDAKIMVALQYKPRKFSEFERALIEEFPMHVSEDAKLRNPDGWRLLSQSHERIWKIPRKTLARRLKVLVAKGWVIRTVLPEHGHHVEYRLNFSKGKQMLEELPVPKLRLTRSQVRLEKKADAVFPLKEEFPALDNLPHDKVLELFLRLRSGELCPKCLLRGEEEKAINVWQDVDGKFYCRNCGEEISIKECDGLLSEILERNFRKRYIEGLKDMQRFFNAIDKQLRK